MAKKKVNKFNPVNWNWTKISAIVGVGLVGFGGAALGANTSSEPVEKVDTTNLVTKKDFKSFSDSLNLQLVDLDNKVDTVNDKLVEDDIWESTAEVLALDELEDRDYKKLYKYMTDELNLVIDDREDIDKVVVKNIEVSHADATDNDATVTMKLRVYYENSDGNDQRVTVYAEAVIEDGDVEDLEFSEDSEFD